MKRLLPFFLLGLFMSSLILAVNSLLMTIIFLMQIGFYVLAAFHGTLLQYLSSNGLIWKLSSVAYYFVMANYGSFLGLLDFAVGRRITKWTPLTADE